MTVVDLSLWTVGRGNSLKESLISFHVFATSYDQWHLLVQRSWLDLHDSPMTGGSASSRLLNDEGQGVAFIKQAEFGARFGRILVAGRLEEDAAL